MKGSPNELREARVHFELYRSLVNCILSNSRFDGIRYTGVEPELKSADLVVKAKLQRSPTNFLVIEVKGRTKLGL